MTVNSNEKNGVVSREKSEQLEREKERERELTNLTAHEAGHILISAKEKIPIMKVNLSLHNGGSVVWDDLTHASKKDRAIAYAAGFASEMRLLDDETVKKSARSSGFVTDSRRLDDLGYTTQEQKVALVIAASKVLQSNSEQLLNIQRALTERFLKQVERGEDVLELDKQEIKEIIQESEAVAGSAG
ncbi:MAG: hypothetical protein NT141_04155 [candidate division WWE3 bacterium]|nr:hypothetical protein [candidate division WWE3 bacterium]